MSTTTAPVQRRGWPLSLEQRFMLLTCATVALCGVFVYLTPEPNPNHRCDGCAHCGSGVPRDKAAGIAAQIVDALRGWGVKRV